MDETQHLARLPAAPVAGHDVVDRQVMGLGAAVLAGVAVAGEDLAAAELHARPRPFHEVDEADDRRSVERAGRGVDDLVVPGNELGLLRSMQEPVGFERWYRARELISDRAFRSTAPCIAQLYRRSFANEPAILAGRRHHDDDRDGDIGLHHRQRTLGLVCRRADDLHLCGVRADAVRRPAGRPGMTNRAASASGSCWRRLFGLTYHLVKIINRLYI